MSHVINYPITFSDGQTDQVGVFFPDSYVEGAPQKWSIFLHPGGTGSVAYTFATYATSYTDAANANDMIFISFSGQGNTGGADWVDTDLTPNKHLEDGIAWAKSVLGLTHYLPCLIGVSMGGFKTIYEMVNFPDRYSSFATGVPAANMKLFYEHNDPGAYIVSVGGYADSTDPVVKARLDQISPSKFLGTADLMGRKLFATFAELDATIPVAIYNEVLANLPTSNSHGVILVPGATHSSATSDPYMAQIYSNFSAESRKNGTVPSGIPLRVKVNGDLREYVNGYVKVGTELRDIEAVYTKVGDDLRW